MIVKMKKITLLCRAETRDEAVDALRNLGVLHVVNLRSPAGEKIQWTKEELLQAEKALDALPDDAADSLPSEKHPEQRKNSDIDEVIDNILNLKELRDIHSESIKEIETEIERIQPFGDFDPDRLKRLSEKGIEVRLYTTQETPEPEAPEGTLLRIFAHIKKNIYFALIGFPRVFEQELPYELFRIPEFSLARLHELMETRKKEREDIEDRLREKGAWRNEIVRKICDLKHTLAFLEVREGMAGFEKVAALQGFCPVPELEKVKHAAADNGWGLVVEDPAPDEKVPTKIYYPRLVRPIKAVFNLLKILPGYHESDISVPFLLFFSLFFAMLIGDAGYGALFLLITIVARKKMPQAPSEVFMLLFILSVATITWGLLTGNIFGITNLPAPLTHLKVPWLQNQNNLMKLCFIIGAVHLTIAHLWNAVEFVPDTRFIAQLGWVCLTWTMYFTAGTMVLQEPFPSWVFVLLFTGLILVVLFMTPVKELKTEWIRHAILPLNVVSCFVDVISYIRLFAVGMATLSVAQSFNNMALAAGFNTIITGFVAAFILFLGHALNIMLCGLGILVHGVRLNTLEFSLHKDMQWSGFPYAPFRNQED